MQKNRLRFVKAGGAGALFLVFAAACSSDSDAPETRSLLQNQVGGAIAFDRVIDVKFKDEADVSLPPQVQSSVLSQSPLFNQPDVFEIGRAWVRLVLVEGADASQVMNQLRKASNVRLVQPAAPIAPPPVTPDFEPNQRYLNEPDAATDPGLGSRALWSIPGGAGQGVTIFDIEYRWNFNHEELGSMTAADIVLVAGDAYPGAGAPIYIDNTEPMNPIDNTLSYTNHGTAAIGVSASADNGTGTTGMAHGASFKMVPEITDNNGYNSADALQRATAAAKPGDVILMEMQTNVCHDAMGNSAGFGPSEWRQDVFDAVEEAVARGIVVVAAAGNGSVDLDDGDCNSNFQRGVRDSGAIIVGSGNEGSITRILSSSYGSRVDIHAWGHNVRAPGYGDAYREATVPDDPNFWYTDFSGTSSASALVAGGVAQLQGILIERYGVPFNSFQMRDLLVRTGTPQDAMAAVTWVAPRLNLAAAASEILAADAKLDIVFLLDLSGSYADDLPNFQNQIGSIVAAIRAKHDDVRFGLASFQDYPTLPFGWPGGEFHEQDGSVTSVPADYVYQLHQQLTADAKTFVTTATSIPAPHPGHGQDGPEAQLDALYTLAAGAAGERAEFREGATKLIFVWTDASFHLPDDLTDDGTPYPGQWGFNDVSQAILALDPPQVMGLSSNGGGYNDLVQLASLTNSLAPAEGIDCDSDGAIDIAAGQPMVCVIVRDENTNMTLGLADTILALANAGVINRDIDLSISLALNEKAEVPSFLRVGEAVTVQVDALVRNHGSSTSELAKLSHVGTDSGAEVVDIVGLVGGAAVTVSRSVTLSCDEVGLKTVSVEARIELGGPEDFFDGMPANNWDNLALSIRCLPTVYATKLLDVRNYSTVDVPDVYGGNDFRLGTDSTAKGNVSVNGDVSLWSRAMIEGDLRYAGFFTEQDGVVVSGIRNPNAVLENLDLPVREFTTSGNNQTVASDSSATWVPGSYGHGVVRARGRVTFQAGTHSFKTLTFEPDSSVIFDTSGGGIVINVEGSLEFGDRAIVVGGAPSSVDLYSGTTGTVRIGTDLDLRAILTAPRGRIHVYSRTDLVASLWAREIILEPQVHLSN